MRDAEFDALATLGPLRLPGLVRPAPDGRTALVDGAPLDRCAAMPWPAAAAALAPVAEALAGMHSNGWVHGDVAPANIVVGADGRGVLVDLDRAAPAGAARPTGTPGWVAPEVVEGAAVSPSAEVWSLAAVAVGAVTGAPPTTGTPVPVPPAAAIALRRALAVDPGSRPTAGELAAVLALAAAPSAPVLTGSPPDPRAAVTTDFGPKPPTPPAAPPAPARRAGPVVAAVLVVVVAASWWLHRPPAPPADRVDPPCAPLPSTAQLAGDPDGDGCDVAAEWQAGVLRIPLRPGGPAATIAVGAVGDIIVLGDWDCDGRDTPAAYRPSTGVVTVWDRWPDAHAPAAPTRTERLPVGRSASIARDEATGCDLLRVGPAG